VNLALLLGRDAFRRPAGSGEVFPSGVRWLGALWVGGAIVFSAVVATFVGSPGAYVFVLIFLSCGAFTAPALIVTWYAVRRVGARDRLGAALSLAALGMAFAIGVGVLVGLATGWSWANVAGVPAVALTGLLHVAAVVAWTRGRSGGRALLVDVVEALTSVLAVTAPLVVLWWPAIVGAEASWFTLPAAVVTVGATVGAYWTIVLFVRLGPGPRLFEGCAVAMAAIGAVNAALQTAQGVSGFTLPAPPLVALNALCFSMYLLIPLHAPSLMRSGLDRLPPQSQVRGARLSTVTILVGLAALWTATLAVAGERRWAVPFALVVVSLLLVLAGVRQMAAAQETRRLYRQVEAAADERRRLLTQLLERSADDRRRFAGQLYAQAISAYTSFSMMAGNDMPRLRSPGVVAQVSARVGDDLARQAESVRELALVIRPRDDERERQQRLAVPVRAYLASIYGDRPTPRLTVDVQTAPELALDWTTETVLLQILQEALHNVWRHSHATQVDVAVHAAGTRVALRVTDDGVGFDPASVPEGSGITTMRAAAAVGEGTLVVSAEPGQGTTVLAHLGPEHPSDLHEEESEDPSPPVLRLVPDK
jgi:signal transduction histidine kinase